jgi:hypothetical protein
MYSSIGERTYLRAPAAPLLWATTGEYENPCRTFAEVSYALLCTVMQFATDVTAKNSLTSKIWRLSTWLRTRGS